MKAKLLKTKPLPTKNAHLFGAGVRANRKAMGNRLFSKNGSTNVSSLFWKFKFGE
jgi:hypothetical protein